MPLGQLPGALDLELDNDEAMFLEGMLNDSSFDEEEEDSYSNNYADDNSGAADHSQRSKPASEQDQDLGRESYAHETPTAGGGGAAEYEHSLDEGGEAKPTTSQAPYNLPGSEAIHYESSSGQDVELPSPHTHSSSPQQLASRSRNSTAANSASAGASYPSPEASSTMHAPPLPTVSETEPTQSSSSPTRMDTYTTARQSMSMYWQAESICKQYNESAMGFLESGKHVAAHELLTKALLMFENGGSLVTDPLDPKTGPISAESAAMIREHRKRLHSLTLNNLGCYYKQRGKLQAALLYLMQAYILEEQRQDSPLVVVPPGGGLYPGQNEAVQVGPSPADLTATQLNLCAVLSGLGRHEQALEHAEAATDVLCEAYGMDERELAAFGQRFVSTDNAGARAGGLPPRLHESVAETVSQRLDAMQRSNASEASSLAVAYFNKAVELEHLEMLPEALSAFTIATAVAVRLQGRASPLAMTCTKSLQSFRQKIKQVARRRLVPTITSSGRPPSSRSAPSSTRPSDSGDRLGALSSGNGVAARESRVRSGNGSSSSRAVSCRGPRASSPMGSRNQPSVSTKAAGSAQGVPRRMGSVGASSSQSHATRGSAYSYGASHPRRGSSASSGPPRQDSHGQQMLPPLYAATPAKAQAPTPLQGSGVQPKGGGEKGLGCLGSPSSTCSLEERMAAQQLLFARMKAGNTSSDS